ncbi:hypothetical protein [Bradyrhizobium retamae]|nr:hypothetical protein [Bradyrhizobium retamae]
MNMNVQPSSIVTSFRSLQQKAHGKRVEERQRVNGQPNGYVATPESELVTAKAYKPTHGGYCA